MFFPYGDTTVASYTVPTIPESCVDLFEKEKKKEDFSLLYKSTAVFNCLHFYLVYRNVDVISKIFWEVSSETWLEFLGSISFTKNGINIAKVLID